MGSLKHVVLALTRYGAPLKLTTIQSKTSLLLRRAGDLINKTLPAFVNLEGWEPCGATVPPKLHRRLFIFQACRHVEDVADTRTKGYQFRHHAQ